MMMMVIVMTMMMSILTSPSPLLPALSIHILLTFHLLLPSPSFTITIYIVIYDLGWKRLDRNPSFDLWNAKEGSNTDARHNEKEAEACTICLDPLFAQGSNSRDPGRYCFELECGHRFHNNCILTWTVSNSTCPICRKDLEKRK